MKANKNLGSKIIRVDNDLYLLIQSYAKPLEDSASDALRNIVDTYQVAPGPYAESCVVES